MRVPVFKETGLTKFLVDVLNEVEKTRRDNMSKTTANHSVLLQSPGDKIYEVTVTDAGVLKITHVQG